MNSFPIYSPKRRPIETEGQWRELAPPRDAERDWRPYGIAMELARRWLGLELPEIDALLESAAATRGFAAEAGHAGLITRYDEKHTRGRRQDLLVVGTAAGGPTLLAVHGRTDEPYGATIEDCLDRRGEAAERLEELARLVFNGPADLLGDLRAALLCDVGVAVLEAARRGVAQVVFLVHELRATVHNAAGLAENAVALDRFVRVLSHGDVGLVPGRLVGPVEIWGGPPLRLYLGKAVATLSAP